MKKENLTVSIGISGDYGEREKTYLIRYNGGPPQQLSNYDDFRSKLQTFSPEYTLIVVNNGAGTGRQLATEELLGLDISVQEAACRDTF